MASFDWYQGTNTVTDDSIYRTWVDSTTSVTDILSTWDHWNRIYDPTSGSSTFASTVTVSYPTTTTNEVWVRWSRDSGHFTTASSGTVTGRIVTATHYEHRMWGEWVQDEVKQQRRRDRQLFVGHRNDERAVLREAQRIEARERQQREFRLRNENRVKNAALERSMLLLRQACNDEQREELEAEGHVTVIGKSGTRYRVTDKGNVANVHVLNENGNVSHRLCAHPGMRVPQGDIMLAQKLMLEHNEEGFVQLANRHLA